MTSPASKPESLRFIRSVGKNHTARQAAVAPRLAQAARLGLLSLVLSAAAHAQGFLDPADWKETDVPPPPAFDLAKLVEFDVARSSSLVFGVDPGSVTISKADGVVRYVIVALSASGAKNVMYEGLRCNTGEVKTYARAKPDGSWAAVEKSEWKSVYDPQLSRHSRRFALAGACEGSAPVISVRELVRRLKTPDTATLR